MPRPAYKRHHHLYQRHVVYGKYVCHYCGDTAPTVDHCPPLATVDAYVDAGIPLETPPLLVPACTECNGILGDASPGDPEERREIAQSRLRRRHQRLLDSPDWTDAELADMAPHMADVIRADLAARDHLRERLKWPQ